MDPNSHIKKLHQSSSSELMSSAKLVAEAAQHTFRHESDKVDKAKVAGAGADLLDAASHYGKLEGTGYGKYVEKAEDYLHKYHSSHGSPTTTVSAHSTTTTTDHHSSAHPPAEIHSESGGGGYFKMAEGFLKKY